MPDLIHIEELVLMTRIGVPDEERAFPQRVTVNVTMTPNQSFQGLEDDIERTVDYAEVAKFLEKLAAERPRRLIETLVEELAQGLLRRYPLEHVVIELRKYILPNAAFVSVRIERGHER